jgi:tryptophanyl-tRNA synthetase
LKKNVVEAVVAGLEPIQKRYAEITADPAYLRGVLRESAERVMPIANSTVNLVKSRLGIYTEA